VHIEVVIFIQCNAKISKMHHPFNHLSINDNTGTMDQCFGEAKKTVP